MKAYRTKIKLNKLKSIIDIPDDIVTPDVEIIIISESAVGRKSQIKKSATPLGGILNKYANPELISKEKETAWTRLVKEKHGLL